MIVLFIIIGVFGVFLFVIGSYWTIQKYRCKEILQFNATEKEVSVNIKEGVYSLGAIGCGFVENPESLVISITNLSTNQNIPLTINRPMPRFSKKMKIGIEIFNFKAIESGNYKMQIENIESLRAKESMLGMLQSLQPKIDVRNLNFLIKESYPVYKTIIGIIFMVIGMNIAAWGIIIAANPDIFLK
jgi:hypothetical protein